MSAIYAQPLPEATSTTVNAVHIEFYEQPAIDDP